MKFLSCRHAAVTLLFLLGIANSQITGDLKIAFLRISFDAEDFPGFTGDGDFLLTSSDICGKYIVYLEYIVYMSYSLYQCVVYI